MLRAAPLRAPGLIGRRVSPTLSQRGMSCRPSCAARSAPQPSQQGHRGSRTSLQDAISKGMVNHILPFKRPGSGLAPRRPQHQQDEFELDTHGEARLKLKTAGWNQWEWRGHKINFVAAGERGPAVVLVHGYGGSVYHWRYNIPQLAKHCRVFAIDCLGFGWSDKPLTDYSGVWADQIADFVQAVVGEAAVLVGNSLGGYSVIHAAALKPHVARGVVLLNAAGGFESSRQAAAAAARARILQTGSAGSPPASSPPAKDSALPPPSTAAASAALPTRATVCAWARALEWARDAALRSVVRLYYNYMEQQSSIEKALKQLYVHKHRIDEDLVRSVAIPAAHPAAEEVVFLLLRAAMNAIPLNALLDSIALHKTPLLLLWGDKDPWTLKNIPKRICRHYPAARLSLIPSGHCPQDDTPQLVNSQLLEWIHELELNGGWL